MSERFFLSAVNPNDGIGGGGCLCSPLKSVDSKGPFAVFPAIETDSNMSPHAVLCLGCAASVCAKAKDGELLESGPRDTVESGADF